MAMASDTRAAIVTARDALSTALSAIAAARALWERDAAGDTHMSGAFPFDGKFPTQPVPGNAYIAEASKRINAG